MTRSAGSSIDPDPSWVLSGEVEAVSILFGGAGDLGRHDTADPGDRGTQVRLRYEAPDDGGAAPRRVRIPFTNGAERGVTILPALRTSPEPGDSSAPVDAPTSADADPLRPDILVDLIRDVRAANPDELIIVAPHWNRGDTRASTSQREFAQAVTRAGADIVIGHDGPMAPEIDLFRGRPLLHGIGGFASRTPGRSSDTGGLPDSIAVTLRLTADGTELRLHPVVTDGSATRLRSHPVTEGQFEDFYLTALERTADSVAFLKAIEPGHDAQGFCLTIPLRRNRRAQVIHHRSGRGTTMTYWEENPVEVRFDRRHPVYQIVLERELRNQGATVRHLGPGIMAGHSAAGVPYLLRTSTTHHTGVPGVKAVKQKDVARTLLDSAGLSIPQGAHFRRDTELDAAADLMQDLGHVVVKPVDGNIGRGVTVGVSDVAALEDAWAYAFSETASGVLVEQQFHGEEVRISVVDGIACSATRRVPPQITGDGVSTIRELINAQNVERHKHLILYGKPIHLAGSRLRNLRRAGLSPLSVLPDGETYVVDTMGSVGSGAHPVHCIEDIDPGYLRIAEQAARTFHDLDIVGVDMLCTDLSQPATAGSYVIIEVNSRPEVAVHSAPPSERAPRSFPARIVSSALAPPKRGPFLPRVRTPNAPASPTSARLLAEEFASRDLTITWLSDHYFRATRGSRIVSVWGSATDRTGASSRSASRNPELARALLRRAHLPLRTPGGTDPSRLRFLVAHGRVLVAIDSDQPRRRNILRRIHPSYRAVAAAAAQAFPGLDLADVALLVSDPRKAAHKEAVSVEHVGAEPDLVEFAEAAGRRADVIRTIVDLHLGAAEPAPEGEVEWSDPPESHAEPTRLSTPAGARRGRRGRRVAEALRRRLP